MRGRTVRFAALCALAVAIGLVAFLATQQGGEQATAVQSPLLGTRAPLLREPVLAPRAAAGTTLALASLRGRVVVLSFFASWCGPCAAEAPNLVAFAWHEHATGARTTVLGVLFDDEDAAGQRFAATYGITFPVLADTGGALANLLDVTSPPVTVVLSPDLRVSAVLEGGVTASELVRATAAARA